MTKRRWFRPTFVSLALIGSVVAVGSVTSPSVSSASPTSCRPLTNAGHCYEPGEFCRHRDRGLHGIAGDHQRIVCRNNNGLRWEPY